MKTLLVIFGITGDLSSRKLLPALSHIINDDPQIDLSILGVSRREADAQQLVLDATANQKLAERTQLQTMDLSKLNDYEGLKQAIKAYDADQTLMYLSVPAGAAAEIVSLLGEAGINTPDIHLLFEKPFGYDLASAQDFLDKANRYYTEDQTYRIDHYMAKEVSAEIIKVRRNNALQGNVWNSTSVKAVDITASESIGVEGRSNFYEQTGALRDFIQGHLMQQLSLVLLKVSAEWDDNQLSTLRLAALSSIAIAQPEDAIRAQYDGYKEEVENTESTTETFASVLLKSNDENWQGVPLRLTSGKALNIKRSSVTVHYQDGTSDTFEEGMTHSEGHRQLDAYERVLLEAIANRKSLFTGKNEVLRSWEILAGVQQAWAANTTQLKYYSKGSSVEAVLES